MLGVPALYVLSDKFKPGGSSWTYCHSSKGLLCFSSWKLQQIVKIKQGAEARVLESTFVGRRSIVKECFSKNYRHPSLDTKLTLKRLNSEARCMTKARRLGVSTPVLYAVDPMLHTLTFEYVDGPSVKDIFLGFGLYGIVEERLDNIAIQIGDAIGQLNDGRSCSW